MSTATRGKRAPKQVRRPERKIGPFHAGLGVAVWLNTVETEQGPKYFRSVTIAPRRYREPATGQWKDAASYRPADLTTIMLALKEAAEFCRSTPLPGQPVDGDELQDLHVAEDGEIVDGQPTA